jgi:uncharacterized protein YkwD
VVRGAVDQDADEYNPVKVMKTRAYLFLIMALVTILAVACGSGGELAATSTDTTVSDLASETQIPNEFNIRIMTSTKSILQTINARRAEAGVAALISHPALVDLAFTRSTNLAIRSSLSHEDPTNGSIEVETSLSEMGYTGPASELIFAARDPIDTVPDRVLEAWFDDPMHKALLLEPTFRYCGIGMMGDGEWWKISMIIAVAPPEEVSE